MQTFVQFNQTITPLTETTLGACLQAIREQKIITLERRLKRMRNADNKMKVKQEIRDLKQMIA